VEEEEEERAAIETKPNKIELEPKLEALSVAASPCLCSMHEVQRVILSDSSAGHYQAVNYLF